LYVDEKMLSAFIVEVDVNGISSIRVNPAPPAGAAHFRPVASALSATILQEQSQRIVPKAIILA